MEYIKRLIVESFIGEDEDRLDFGDPIEDTVIDDIAQKELESTKDKLQSELVDLESFKSRFSDPKKYRRELLLQVRRKELGLPTVVDVDLNIIPSVIKEFARFYQFNKDGTIVTKIPDGVYSSESQGRGRMTKMLKFLDTGKLTDITLNATKIVNQVAAAIAPQIIGDHPTRRMGQLERTGVIDGYINVYAAKNFFDIFDLNHLKPKIKERVLTLRKG